MGTTGVYPGSFDPPTVAHLAVAFAAHRQGRLDKVVLAVSRVALGKEGRQGPSVEDRLGVLQAVAATRPWLAAAVTDHQLIADVASGYDAVIVGADKWAQILDPAWYGSEAARDAALARLPRVLVVPRPPFSLQGGARLELPAGRAELLELPGEHGAISSTAVREGRREWMAPEAYAFDEQTGAWSDPDRYRRWREAAGHGQV